MCLFITATLPATAAFAPIEAIARAHGRRFRAQSNASIEAQIGEDRRSYVTTPGHCDCGTVLGSRSTAKGRATDWAKEEHKLARKGWSDARIARAIAQKRASEEDHDANAIRRAESELFSWQALIASVLASGKASEIGLLLHMYSGALDAPFAMRETRHLGSSDTIRDVLLAMDEDVLYVFRK